MKRSIKQRYHIMLGVLFALILIQFAAILYTISQARDIYTLASDIQSIMVVFLFVIFVYIMVIFNYLPIRLSKAVRRVEGLIHEISNGNYQIDIDASLFEQDKDFQELIFSLKKMLEIITRFDAVKADKIYEHDQRISRLINLLPQMIVIATVNGEVVYINNAFRERFPLISETTNLNEVIQKDDFYAQIFDSITQSLRYGQNVDDDRIEPEGSSRMALIKGSVIRTRKGITSGGVFTVEMTGAKEEN